MLKFIIINYIFFPKSELKNANTKTKVAMHYKALYQKHDDFLIEIFLYFGNISIIECKMYK